MEKREKKITPQEFFPIVKELLVEHRQAVFTVNGYSMLPFIGSRRDQVVLENCAGKKLKKGDVILFQKAEPPQDYILHRIYRIQNGVYQTMGDGNTWMDEEITEAQIIGRVVKIHRLGKEIDCGSLKWKMESTVWRWLKPFRKVLIGGYRKLSEIKKGRH